MATTTKARGSLRFHQGAWRIAIRAGRHADGSDRWVRETVNAPNTKAGQRAAEKVQLACTVEADRLKALGSPRNHTLLDAIDAYMAWVKLHGGKAKHGAAPGTMNSYRDSRKIVVAYPLAQRKVTAIAPAHLSAMYEHVGTSRGQHSALQVHRLVHAAINHARSNGLPVENPAAAARKPTQPKMRTKGVRKLKPSVIAAMLSAVQASDPYYFAWLRVSAMSGARPSSVAGLRWGDIDLDAGTIRFERAAVAGTVDGYAGLTVKATKAENVYTIAIDPTTVAILRAHRRWWVERHLAKPDGTDEWVFPSTRDMRKPAHVRAMSTRWYRVRRLLGAQLDGVRLYDLRHYVATQMFGQGDDPITVAGRLGHTNANTTMAIYADFLPDRDRDSADRLAAAVDGTGG